MNKCTFENCQRCAAEREYKRSMSKTFCPECGNIHELGLPCPTCELEKLGSCPRCGSSLFDSRTKECVMCSVSSSPPMALDVSLEKARALHRVWRALNDGDCPGCHKFHAATDIIRTEYCIECPDCRFYVTKAEIDEIEKLFAPAMGGALKIFIEWRNERA